MAKEEKIDQIPQIYAGFESDVASYKTDAACRRIYSLHTCSAERPPILHRFVMKTADDAIGRLQLLDDTGYSGHLSFILFMLENPKFLETYLSGDYRPDEIMQFGKSHRIVINRMLRR